MSLTDPGRAIRIGMITPSSNTCLEPMTYRMLEPRDDVTVHSTRISVTRIALDDASDRQFDLESMRQSAELLATAQVDVIAWNGTSGSWLGLEHDRALVAEITRATGVPATTSTLALLDAMKRFGLTRISLATPYTSEVNARIADVLSANGIEIDGSVALGLTDNESFARVSPARLLSEATPLAVRSAHAIVVLCTNLWGAMIVEQVERDLRVPVLDSVATTLWRCLDLAGGAPLDPKWGALLA